MTADERLPHELPGYRRNAVHRPALVAELLKAGHAVTVLHRKPKHDLGPHASQNLMADRNDRQGHARRRWPAQSFEVVFDNVYDWERGTTAAQVEGHGARGRRRSRSATCSCRAWRLMATG